MGNQKKITLVTDAPYCKDIRSQRTVESLVLAGANVSIIDQGFSITESRRVLPKECALISSPIPQKGISKFFWHIQNHLFPLNAYKKRCDWTASAIEKTCPDIIHCVNIFSLEASYIAAIKTGAKLIYEPLEYWPEHVFSEEYGLRVRLSQHLHKIEKSILPCASLVIAVSPTIAKWYTTIGKAQNTEVVYNANVPTERLVRSNLTEKTTTNRVTFVHSGLLVSNRNISTLIKAFSGLKNSELIIQGNGPEEMKLRKKTETLGLFTSVQFIDMVPFDNLISSLADYDVGVLSAFNNTFQTDGALPNKLFDYMSAGLAMVAFKTTALLEFPNIKQFCIFADEQTPESLHEALRKISDDTDTLSKMKNTAYNESKKYSREKQIQKIITIYRKIGV